MMKKTYRLIIVITFLISLHSKAQNEVIPIWKDTIPRSIYNKDYKENEIYKDGILQKTSQVTTPTLLVFKPKEVKPNGTAVLILPGGGYGHLSMDKEGKKVAEWFNSLGITAFVLKYRLPNDIVMKDKTIGPLQDAQESMRFIRRNALKWKLDPNTIGVIGFSAGGHLASTLSTHYDQRTYATNDTTSARPDFTLLIYPVVSMKNEITHKGSQANLLGGDPSDAIIEKYSNELCTNQQTPPAFIVHTSDDSSVPVANSIAYFLALKKSNVPVELHVYEKGGHGFGLGIKDTSEFWTLDCINWLKDRKIIHGNE
jgi:acetyl esterase/lipase